LVLGITLGVALVATASLALAHVGAHSLGGVVLASAVAMAAIAAAALRLGGRPSVARDRSGLATVLVSGTLAASMFLPGFSYGVADKDPGVYVAHAVEISRGGSYSFTDPAIAEPGLPVQLVSPGARFPAVWVEDGETGLIVPQFYHLWPALLASAHEMAGIDGIRATTPLVAVLAVMLLVSILRRIGGVVAAAFGGLLLSTNMLEVWQAKFPTTEALAQALFLGVLFAFILAVQTRWRPCALVGGLLVGVGFLNRPDAWLTVMMAGAGLAAVYATRRDDRSVYWALAGFGAVLPYGMWQAYSAAATYTYANQVPGFYWTTALLVAAAAGAVIARVLLRRPLTSFVDKLRIRRVQIGVGLGAFTLLGGLMALGFLRPRIFGEDLLSRPARPERSYDEQNMRRLSWFLTLPGMWLAWLGFAVVTLRRWRGAAWLAVLPPLLLAILYIYQAQVATRLMWWARRYVPNVLPVLIILMALALAFAFAWRYRGRRVLALPAVAVMVALTAAFLSQSLPLRTHDEWRGSFEVSERIARLSGERRGIYLWPRALCCATSTVLWAPEVWLTRGELSVLLTDVPAERAAYVRAYRGAFPDDPVFVVSDGPQQPKGLAGVDLREVDHLSGTLPMWEESDVERPDAPREIPYELRVYRVRGT
jgi:hypothetical protein